MMDLSIRWLVAPWPWYVAGPVIGFMVPLMLLIGNRSFGISSNLRHLCAITQPRQVGVDFFSYNWREQTWSLVFAGGTVVGGVLAGVVFANPDPVQLSDATRALLASWGIRQARELIPAELFGLGWRNAVLLVFGGILVGFGTRYAAGCTSGHAITGLSAMQPQSLIAVVGIFAGGMFSAHFILPLLF